MIVVAAVLDVELPVVVHELAVAAENLELAMQRALDVLDHYRPEVIAQRRRLIRESREHEPLDCFDSEARQAVRLLVEVRRHAAFLLNAFFECDARETAIE